MADDENINEVPENEEQPKMRTPSLLRNYISFVGMAIIVSAVTSDLLLFLIEITATSENAYIGILTYIILP